MLPLLLLPPLLPPPLCPRGQLPSAPRLLAAARAAGRPFEASAAAATSDVLAPLEDAASRSRLRPLPPFLSFATQDLPARANPTCAIPGLALGKLTGLPRPVAPPGWHTLLLCPAPGNDEPLLLFPQWDPLWVPSFASSADSCCCSCC